MSKMCSSCCVIKPLTDFHHNKSRVDGFAPWCKECQNPASRDSARKRKKIGKYNFVEGKTCPRCGAYKKAICFSKDSSRIDCLTVYCKVCMNFEKREKYKNNPLNYLLRAKKYFLSKLGMDLDDYSKVEKSQNKVCAICGLSEIRQCRGRRQKLAIDHNHNTMKFRGLLCAKCNTALGLLNVDNFGTLNLRRAIAYLQENHNVTS